MSLLTLHSESYPRIASVCSHHPITYPSCCDWSDWQWFDFKNYCKLKISLTEFNLLSPLHIMQRAKLFPPICCNCYHAIIRRTSVHQRYKSVMKFHRKRRKQLGLSGLSHVIQSFRITLIHDKIQILWKSNHEPCSMYEKEGVIPEVFD